jgi:hypothetical protein
MPERSLIPRLSPKARLVVAGLAFLAVTALTYLVGHPRMFFAFPPYDDEGYMLTVLHSFLQHGNLYDDVFAQYGPFYYETWGALFSGFGIAVNHDGGRSVTLAVWILSSLVLGLATARLTGSYLLGLGTQMLVFAALGSLVDEPMHPGGLICLLLAAIVAISCGVRAKASPGAMALLGGAVGALLMVKANVGAFALAAVVLACAVSYAPLARRWIRLPIEAGFVLVPFVLITGKLGDEWARHYAVHVAIAALCVVIALRVRENRRRPGEELRRLLGGLLAVLAASCLAILAAGTSPGGLVEGLVGQPLRQADAFSLPFVLAGEVNVFDAVALAAALAYLFLFRRRRPSSGWTVAISLLSIFVGIELALSPVGETLGFDLTGLSGYPLSLLAFAWVSLIPVRGEARADTAFARLLLPPLAVLQALHAYPVAGSQVLWAAFLLVPVGALCVANGVRGLVASVSAERMRLGLSAVLAVAAVGLLGFVANVTLREPLNEARAAYDARVPLGLPGAEDVRLDPLEVNLYRRLTHLIDLNCRAFVMLPGMDSFYIWTRQDPPSGFNATGWPTLFDDAHQRRVIAEIDPVRGLCLLENMPLAEGWSAGTIPDTPLVRFMRREFEPFLRIGDYRLLKRVRGGEPTS